MTKEDILELLPNGTMGYSSSIIRSFLYLRLWNKVFKRIWYTWGY